MVFVGPKVADAASACCKLKSFKKISNFGVFHKKPRMVNHLQIKQCTFMYIVQATKMRPIQLQPLDQDPLPEKL